MSTIIRRLHTSRRNIGPYKRHELLTGECIYPSNSYTGYGEGIETDVAAFIDDEMRADWEANRDELMEFWRSGEVESRYFPDGRPWLAVCGSRYTLPWAAVVFDAK